jgi:hypothetical protein
MVVTLCCPETCMDRAASRDTPAWEESGRCVDVSLSREGSQLTCMFTDPRKHELLDPVLNEEMSETLAC